MNLNTKRRHRRQEQIVALVGAAVVAQIGVFLLLVLVGHAALIAATALFLFAVSINTMVFRAYRRALAERD